MFRQIAQAEAKRQKDGEQALAPIELKRIQDSMRLYKTKLTNIAQTLGGLQAQKEWLQWAETNGNKCVVVRHIEQFIEEVKNYLGRQ